MWIWVLRVLSIHASDGPSDLTLRETPKQTRISCDGDIVVITGVSQWHMDKTTSLMRIFGFWEINNNNNFGNLHDNFASYPTPVLSVSHPLSIPPQGLRLGPCCPLSHSPNIFRFTAASVSAFSVYSDAAHLVLLGQKCFFKTHS